MGDRWTLKPITLPLRAGEGMMTSLGDWDQPALRN
jgi:hypothetical protein